MALNPLAVPKGAVAPKCELCGAKALISCPACKVTFYCSKACRNLDAEAIHSRICEFIGPLRRAPSSLGTEKDRAQRKEQQMSRKQHLMRLTKLEAEKHCNQGCFNLAVPAALQSLKLGVDVFGKSSCELLSIYVLLGRCSIGDGALSQAETYLTQANFIVLKMKECDHSKKAQLLRVLGQLYDAKGNSAQAISLLADDIYHSSLVHGTEGVECAGGFYFMGDVFNRDGKTEAATAFFQQTVVIWEKHLRSDGSLDVSSETEALQQLNAILAFFQATLPADDTRTALALLALGALYLAMDLPQESSTYLHQAQAIAPDHQSTKDLEVRVASQEQAVGLTA